MTVQKLIKTQLAMVIILLGFAGFSSAAYIEYDFTIQFLEGTSGTNPYGISVGETITLEINYDQSQGNSSAPGLSMHDNSNDNLFDISMTFGNKTYFASDDVNWNAFPIVTFNTAANPADWSINTIDFWIIDNNPTYNSWIRIETPGINENIVLNAGSQPGSTPVWRASSVPEPATMTLLGLGLLGLAGISRRSVK